MLLKWKQNLDMPNLASSSLEKQKERRERRIGEADQENPVLEIGKHRISIRVQKNKS